MKSALLFSVLVLSLHAHALTFNDGGPEPAVEPVALDAAYIPEGFDSNDKTQIVVEGWFTSSCYRFGNARVQIDNASKTIKIAPIAFVYGGTCLDVMVPFHTTIDIGVVKPGKYRVVEIVGGKTIGQMPVAEARTEAADDFLYASVSQAFLDVAGRTPRVVLAGEFNNTCMEMADIKTFVQGNTIVVLPIAKMNNRGLCKPGRAPFQHVIPVEVHRSGRYLLHVRSLNGNAINMLVDVP
jgi:hypothetical protein